MFSPFQRGGRRFGSLIAYHGATTASRRPGSRTGKDRAGNAPRRREGRSFHPSFLLPPLSPRCQLPLFSPHAAASTPSAVQPVTLSPPSAPPPVLLPRGRAQPFRAAVASPAGKADLRETPPPWPLIPSIAQTSFPVFNSARPLVLPRGRGQPRPAKGTSMKRPHPDHLPPSLCIFPYPSSVPASRPSAQLWPAGRQGEPPKRFRPSLPSLPPCSQFPSFRLPPRSPVLLPRGRAQPFRAAVARHGRQNRPPKRLHPGHPPLPSRSQRSFLYLPPRPPIPSAEQPASLSPPSAPATRPSAAREGAALPRGRGPPRQAKRTLKTPPPWPPIPSARLPRPVSPSRMPSFPGLRSFAGPSAEGLVEAGREKKRGAPNRVGAPRFPGKA